MEEIQAHTFILKPCTSSAESGPTRWLPSWRSPRQPPHHFEFAVHYSRLANRTLPSTSCPLSLRPGKRVELSSEPAATSYRTKTSTNDATSPNPHPSHQNSTVHHHVIQQPIPQHALRVSTPAPSLSISNPTGGTRPLSRRQHTLAALPLLAGPGPPALDVDLHAAHQRAPLGRARGAGAGLIDARPANAQDHSALPGDWRRAAA